jgi:hypothetical protein
MEFKKSDIALAYLTLLCGLTISAVAIWYSVAGLVAIFAAAAIPIIIMGTVLETSKLVATVWLKWNWTRAPFLIKTYLLTAILVLMMITSMGIFGFLSKAHIDQAVPAGDSVAKVQIIDEKIKIQEDIIAQFRKDLAILNTQIDKFTELGAVSRGVAERNRQQAERNAIIKKIEESQAAITSLREERAPLASQVRALEAEVGPIKYIAALIYGDNPDADLLEKAVRWVIIIIVAVFDPLAVVMLLASQTSFQWFRQQRKEAEELAKEKLPQEPEPVDTGYVHGPWPFTVQEPEEVKEERTEPVLPKEYISGDVTAPERFGLDKEELEPEKEPKEEIIEETIEEDIPDDIPPAEKAAMKRWKEENPNDSLKHQRRLFELKLIDRLPWHDYLEAKPDYVQNEEQSSSTIWQRLKNIKK